MVRYIGSAEHRKIIHDSKKIIMDMVRIATEMHLKSPNPKLKQSIKEVFEEYKKL